MKSPLEALLIHCVLSISSFISILSFLQYMLSSCNLGRLCLEVLLDFNFLAESSSADLRHKLALGYQSFLPPITWYESGCFIRLEENKTAWVEFHVYHFDLYLTKNIVIFNTRILLQAMYYCFKIRQFLARGLTKYVLSGHQICR